MSQDTVQGSQGSGWLKYNVSSPTLIGALLVVLALSYASLFRGEMFQLVVHDGMALALLCLLAYAAHAQPQPEPWRRRLIMFCAACQGALMISG